MKLEYLDKVNEHGDSIVRLYDFNMFQAKEFQKDALKKIITESSLPLDLTTLEFIQVINCSLTLRIADKATGIITTDKKSFFCDLTISGYEEMILLIEPFCKKESSGFQWLYDNLNPTDFLFSPNGT